jgi:hypothetical protein
VINEEALVKDFFLEAAEKSGLTLIDWVVDPKTQKRTPVPMPTVLNWRPKRLKFSINRKQTRQIAITASYDGKVTLILKFVNHNSPSWSRLRLARHQVERFDLTNPMSENQIIHWIQKKIKLPKVKARAKPAERRMRRQRHRGVH